MILKYKKKRLLFIKIYSAVVGVLFLINLWALFAEGDTYLNIITTVLLAFFCFGLLFYQNARYDDQRIIGQFGWPKIYYKDITEVKYFAGDVVIKTKKRSFGINKQTADEESLLKFKEILEQQTEFRLNIA
ncbi:hypothetical protein [Flavobacteriaceae bacterium 14752]|uniref:hypothetical protein n=1 Tax=Mesohalobacter salilacus TaxID=2491711 RepID=UPI000F63639C|nr:hypothetical protein EIG84_02285 [Flavobacteriaceae bacterium 14752]